MNDQSGQLKHPSEFRPSFVVYNLRARFFFYSSAFCTPGVRRKHGKEIRPHRTRWRKKFNDRWASAHAWSAGLRLVQHPACKQDPSPMPTSVHDTFYAINVNSSHEEEEDISRSRSKKSVRSPTGAKERMLEKELADQRVDDDDEFDWNDDPDQPRPRRRKTTRQRIQEAMQRPCCWSYLSPFTKRVIFALVGSIVFITPAVCVNLLLPAPTEEERAAPNFKNIRSNLQLWFYWAAFVWHIGWLTTVVVEAVPSAVSMWTKLFHGRRSEKVKSAMEVRHYCCPYQSVSHQLIWEKYYMSLKGYLALLMIASWNWGSWAFLTDYPYNVS